MIVAILSSGITIMLIGLGYCAQETGERLPVPDQVKQNLARIEVKQILGKEYRQGGVEILQHQSKKLLKLGRETHENPPMKFVLLDEARKLAVAAKDFKTALVSIDELANCFEVDSLPMKTEILEVAIHSRAKNGDLSWIQICLDVLDETFESHSFGTIKKLKSLASRLLRKIKSPWIRWNIQARIEKLNLLKDWEGIFSSSREKLRKNSTDPEANHDLGRFYCLILGKWKEGLEYLELSPDKRFQALARMEISVPGLLENQLELASTWSELAEKEEGYVKEAMQMRAYYWHRIAHASASGMNKAMIENKMHLAPRRYLSDMEEYDVLVGVGELGKGRVAGLSVDSSDIKVDGLKSRKGLCLHAVSRDSARVKYRLKKSYRRLRGFAALNHTSKPEKQNSSITYLVIGDGKILWKSKSIRGRGNPQPFEIKVDRVEEIELRAHCSGAYDWLHCVWLDPEVVK